MRDDIGQTADSRITLPGTTEPMEAFLARPAASRAGGPAVVVIQEWWGLTDDITGIASRLARDADVLALAPDLYHGRRTSEPDEAQKLAMGLDRDAALADLRAAVSWLVEHGVRQVGAMGFCMGAGLVWDLALADPRIVAAAPCYGLTELRDGRHSSARIEAHYGTADRFTPELLDEVEGLITRWNPANRVHRYDGAPHAFLNESHRHDAPEAASLAWSRIVALFRETLS